MASTTMARKWRLAAVGAVLYSAFACNRQTQQQPGVDSRPAGEPATTSVSPQEHPSRRSPGTQATRPATDTAPATRPREELPASTFDTDPPYTVQLYVRKPEDKQPGWLKILELTDEDAVAKARGVFPRQNITEVSTDNVRRIQVELGYLPLGEGKRVVLRIDDQGIEITQRDRRYVRLERRPTGQWVVEKPTD